MMHDSLTIALLQAREAAMGYFRPIVKRHNLTEQQWRIVRVLAEHPSMDFHDLAFRTCILRPSLTGILTRMERDGLVLRLKPVTDQRKLYVSLTKEGNALYQRAQAQVEEAYQQIEAEYTPEKMKQLTALLEEFIELGNRHIAARTKRKNPKFGMIFVKFSHARPNILYLPEERENMLNRIKIVTSLLLVLAIFGLLQLTSGGLFFNALKHDKENFTILQTIRQQQSTLNGSWVALLQTRNTLNRAGIRYMMDQNNIGSGSTVAELMQIASASLKQAEKTGRITKRCRATRVRATLRHWKSNVITIFTMARWLS